MTKRPRSRRLRLLVLVAVLGGGLYLALWPVPLKPVAWAPPSDPGYTGAFAENTRLAGLEMLEIAGKDGPEDVVLDAEGRIYVTTRAGHIVRIQADGKGAEVFAETGGMPLGLVLHPKGDLIVCDAVKGLLSIAPDGKVTTLATKPVEGEPFAFTNNADVLPDGRVVFTDATSKFGAFEWGGTLEACKVDLMEHGGHGRLLVYDPEAKEARVLASGLQFANGVAASHDGRSVLFCETGSYRVSRYWLEGPKKGQVEVVIDALPGFPDNLTRGKGGRYWLGFASPRRRIIDALAGWPRLREVVMRLPEAVHPGPVLHAHIIAIDDAGEVVADLQDPSGRYPISTGAFETDAHLYVSSLHAHALGRLAWSPSE